MASACCGRREASGGGGEPSPHAVLALCVTSARTHGHVCVIGVHVCIWRRAWEFTPSVCACCVCVLRRAWEYTPGVCDLCALWQSAGVYSERLRMLTCNVRSALECIRACAHATCFGGRAWGLGSACAHLCVRFAFCPASAEGDGLRRCRGSFSADMPARNSAACFAASHIASVPGICPLSMLAAGQFARDIACDRATSSSGSRCSGGASRVRLGDGERERALSRSRAGCEAPSARGGLGEGEGERERVAWHSRASCGVPSA